MEGASESPLPSVVPHLIYDDVGAAADWLVRAFGFRERERFRHVLAGGRVGRTQLDVADGVVTLGLPSVHGESPRGGVSAMLYVYVAGVDEHLARARAAGAIIDGEPIEHEGDRRYQATDPEGHHWTFAERVG